MASYRHSYVFRLAVNPVVYIWTGHGRLATPGDTLDPTGALWLGGAHIASIPTLKALLNGIADRQDISLSGVSAESLRLAQEDRAEVQGAAVHIGRVEFDENWQVVGTIHWEWRGVADTLSIASEQSDRGRQRRITLSIRTGDTYRSNPLLAFFTDADQRRRSPDDAFFSHVGQITSGTSRRFGPS